MHFLWFYIVFFHVPGFPVIYIDWCCFLWILFGFTFVLLFSLIPLISVIFFDFLWFSVNYVDLCRFSLVSVFVLYFIWFDVTSSVFFFGALCFYVIFWCDHLCFFDLHICALIFIWLLWFVCVLFLVSLIVLPYITHIFFCIASFTILLFWELPWEWASIPEVRGGGSWSGKRALFF